MLAPRWQADRGAKFVPSTFRTSQLAPSDGISGEPTPALEEAEAEFVRRMNPPDVFDEWRAEFG